MVSDTAPRRVRGLWLRWSWRDLRSHWVAVVAIALVLAIGSGVWAGLGSTATWRRETNDASFAAVHMHDLRATLSPGTFTDAGTLTAAAAGIEHAEWIEGAVERLVVDTQVDATTASERILVAGRIVGMPFDAEPAVDSVWIRDGTAPTAAPDGGGADVVLEAKFADFYDLPVTGSVTLAGGTEVGYGGLGIAPEDFYVTGPEGTIFAQGELAILYLPLAEAQGLADQPGQVNDLVITLVDGAVRDVVELELSIAMDGLEGITATVANQDEDEAFRVLYEDIENDQQIWNAISALVLFAAALAASNLISRIVEAQRREIGIGMALGVDRWRLAIRPLLVGAQIAVLGVIAGLGVGYLVGNAMGDLLKSFLPLPEYRTPFQYGVYAQAAALGLIVPIVASAIPVWRAIRVEPIEAIRTGHLTAKSSRITDWSNHITLPGSTLTQMPLRNVLRTPRRTMLTAVGVGAAITALVAVMGMLDSFTATIDRGSDELTRGDPDRVIVQLDTFYPTDDGVVTAVAATPTVAMIDPGLRLPATAPGATPDEDIDVLVELVDLDAATWTPSISGAAADVPVSDGLLLARKAADDLGVEVGDAINLRHPVRDEQGGFRFAESEFTVTGIHGNPIRNFMYGDLALAERFGLTGLTNVVQAYPTDAADRGDLQYDIFELDGVTSSQAVARVSEVFDEALEQFVGFLAIAAVAVLILALLIAFNATRITVEERQREHATMRAYGLPVRSVIGVVIKESVLVGVVATAIGVGAGVVFLGWMLQSLAARTLPDLGIDLFLAPTTIAAALIVGVLAVSLAPLLLVRRLRRMSIPDTLRVME